MSGVGGLCWFVGVEGSSSGEGEAVATALVSRVMASGGGLCRCIEWLPEEVREWAGGVGGSIGPLRMRLD